MRYSLTTKITIIFAIGFIVICTLFFMFFKLQNERLLEKISENHYNSISWLLSLYQKSNMPEDWERYFKNFDLAYVKNANLQKAIFDHGTLVSRSDTLIGIVDTISYKNNLYLRIKNQSVTIILESTLHSGNDSILASFIIVMALFI